MSDKNRSSPIPSSPPAANGQRDVTAASPMDVDMDGPRLDPQTSAKDTSKPDRSGAVPGDDELENLLSGDWSDDDFAEPSHQVQSAPSNPPPAKVTTTTNYSDPAVMRAFYQRLFPFRPLFQWLNHSVIPSTDFSNREFAFTLPNDAYLRYQSFPTADLLRRQCVQMLPSRFEIGPVYSTNPRDRKTLRSSTAFRPVAKELVFDIDMTDYDPIRTCCSGTAICRHCWAFIGMAIKVVDSALRDDFGFEHVLWVYSGRRGAHAWVCDKRARDLDDQQRKAITGYLILLKTSNGTEKQVNEKRPLHPHVERSLQLLKGHFQADILKTQDPWRSPEGTKKLVGLLAEFPSLSAALARKWESTPGRESILKWTDIDAEASSGLHPTLKPEALLEAKQDIVLEYTYARLDVEVSRKRGHLLKSPFVVHPGTGRVCVPIDIAKFGDFDPLTVPTVTDLLQQIDEWDQVHAQLDEGGGADGVESGEKNGIPPVRSSSPVMNDIAASTAASSPGMAPLRRDLDGLARRRDGDVDAADGDGGGGSNPDPPFSLPGPAVPTPTAAMPTPTTKRIPDWDKTDLKPYVDHFRLFVARLIRAESARVKRELDQDPDRRGIDF